MNLVIKDCRIMGYIKLFASKQIRTVWNESDQKWYFVVADIVQVLTDAEKPREYLKRMRKRNKQLSQEWGQIATLLSIETTRGKKKANCANAQNLLKIIQSIPSPKVKPFKLWLNKVVIKGLNQIEKQGLEKERKNEGIKEQIEYTLTAKILNAPFGLTPSEYKNLKDQKAEYLKYPMTDLELTFSILAEALVKEKEKAINKKPLESKKTKG
ncbi:MAG: Bro-N domain-containing protein [Tenuifilaceae bacterium]|nr:Bro-N domain-containing protein [Tenuifilaceae bacterium]